MNARPACWPRDATGVVYVEFLLAFIPLFVLFLGGVQLALMAVAQLTVQHAAVRGARSAAVVLHDDPARYDGLQRGDLRGPPEKSSDWGGVLAALGLASGEAGSQTDDEVSLGGPRLAAIRRAVYFPLATIAPEPGQLAAFFGQGRGSLRDAVGGAPLLRLLMGLATYTGATTAVTLPVAPGSDETYDTVVPANAAAIVRVTHLFHCAVPLAATLMCNRLGWSFRGAKLGWTTPKASDATAFEELSHAPGKSLQAALAASNARFVLLVAEASMPMHAAAYRYASEEGG